MEDIIKEFVEKGADLEHQRWSKWQSYVFSLCKKNKDGSLTISKERVAHWEKEIATPYSELTEKLKEYDREETRQYIPLLKEALDEQQKIEDERYAKAFSKGYGEGRADMKEEVKEIIKELEDTNEDVWTGHEVKEHILKELKK